MRKSQWLSFLIVSGVVVSLSAAAMAMDKTEGAGPEKGARMGHEGHMDWQKDGDDKALGLSDEQRTQMKALRTETRGKMEALRADIKSKRQALGQEMESVNPDRAKVDALLKDVSALEVQIGQDRIDNIFKVKAILTPEQFKKLSEIREKRKAEMKEKHGGKGWERRGEKDSK